MKKANILIALVTAAIAVTSLTASVSAETTNDEISVSNTDEVISGGWAHNQGKVSMSIKVNKEAREAFNKATAELVGCTYSPVALLGTQVVAGTNYCILCRVTPVYPDAQSYFSLVYIYEDLLGNAEVSGFSDLELSVPYNDNSTEDIVQIPNPFVKYETIAEAAKVTGFTLKYGSAVKINTIQVIDDSILQVTSGENDDITIRKAKGTDDISGDYNTYENSSTKTINEATVTLKGNGKTISAAIWTRGKYTYSVTSNSGISVKAMTNIIKTVK